MNAVIALVHDHVDRHADRPALVTRHRTTTYGQLADGARRAAAGLAAAGVGPGDRVLLSLPDSPGFVEVFLGALHRGAVAVCASTLEPDHHVARMLDLARPAVVVTDPGSTAQRVARSQERTTVSPGELRAHAPDRGAPALVNADAPALWLFTSGTTGTPKAVVHTHAGALAGRSYGRLLQLDARDRVFSASKLFFAYGLGNALLNPLTAGASAYLLAERPTPADIGAVVARFAPTLLFAVPSLYARMVEDATLPDDLLAGVRTCVSAGEALPATLHERFGERFGQQLCEGLGATETIFMVLSNDPREPRPGAQGRPLPDAEVRLSKPDGRLEVQAPARAAGVVERPGEPPRPFPGGWLDTGDLFTVVDGHLAHQGRVDDVFKVRGVKVAPVEVEQAILRVTGVREAAVVGIEAGSGLIDAHALVVLAPPPDRPADLAAALDRILDEVGAVLQGPRLPRVIHAVDALPRTATGKVRRHELRTGRFPTVATVDRRATGQPRPAREAAR